MGKVYVWTWVAESLCRSDVCCMERPCFPYPNHRYEDGSVRYLWILVNSFDLLDYITVEDIRMTDKHMKKYSAY